MPRISGPTDAPPRPDNCISCSSPRWRRSRSRTPPPTQAARTRPRARVVKLAASAGPAAPASSYAQPGSALLLRGRDLEGSELVTFRGGEACRRRRRRRARARLGQAAHRARARAVPPVGRRSSSPTATARRPRAARRTRDGRGGPDTHGRRGRRPEGRDRGERPQGLLRRRAPPDAHLRRARAGQRTCSSRSCARPTASRSPASTRGSVAADAPGVVVLGRNGRRQRPEGGPLRVPRLRRELGAGARASSAQADPDATTAPDSFIFLRHKFPIRGAHNYGDGAATFGGGRGHQGHDVFAECGTPLVAARGGDREVQAELPGRARALRRHRRRGRPASTTSTCTCATPPGREGRPRPHGPADRLRRRHGPRRRLPPALRAVGRPGLVHGRRPVRPAAAAEGLGPLLLDTRA